MLTESWQIVVALSSSGVVVIGGSVAFWRRALTRARKDGSERGVVLQKLEGIEKTLGMHYVKFGEIHDGQDAIRNTLVTQGQAVVRIEATLKGHMDTARKGN